jgi:hypothetical protein
MTDVQEDLSGHYQTQRSQIINHPEYANPVLMTQYGWAKRGQKTQWYETRIEERA